MESEAICGGLIEARDGSLLRDNFYTPSNQEIYKSNLYSDLNPSKREIRLLELLQVKDDKPLNVNLISACSLSSDIMIPSYSAISYFAGSHRETEVIYVNGVRFNAFANLARSLRQIIRVREGAELQEYPQLVWVDQICINQSNPAERSHQVGFMRSIYENAGVVLACLGEDPSNGRWIEAAKRLNFGPMSPLDVDLTDRMLHIEGRVLADFDDKDFQRDWISLGDILRSPWWQRGWIYQEILVARKVSVLFGNGVLDWETLSRAVHTVDHVAHTFVNQLYIGQNTIRHDQMDRIISMGYISEYAEFLIRARKGWQEEHESNILELLDHARGCSVTDLRDRVFAFIRLANPGYGITPDYNIDAPTVFRLACKRIILYESSLNVLGCCNKSSNGPRREDIPSWTPDLFSIGYCIGFIYDPILDFPPFRASAGYRSAAAFHSQKDSLDSVLRVQCLFIDHLATPSSLSHTSGHDSRQDLQVWKRIAGLGDANEDNEEGPNYFFDQSISTSDAFWRVVLRGIPCHGVNDDTDTNIQKWARDISDAREDGQFFRSPKGYLGVTKRVADPQYSDLICVLLGANIPFILRKVGDLFAVVSDAYIEGLMYGEAIEMMRRGDLVVETIDIH